MKTKSTAKGDPKLSKDYRYALTIHPSSTIQEEVKGKLKFPLALYFDKRYSLGQVMDDLVKTLSIKSVLDYDQLQDTQLLLASANAQGEL